ncbi:MAG: glutaredoxin [Clostridia bacterium]|nr:glutaredoxin [Clostridia bacterium]
MKLELYKMDSCPYCRRVMRYIEAEGRNDITYRDITLSEDAEQTLIRVGGKRQVPCLFIDGKPMYESLDIIDWLKAHPQNV